MASKRKTISAVIAVALTAAILLGGTFAWQSISQEALNEVYGFVNPGGRLHDDFHEITDPEKDTTRQFDKNVYVENFTTVLDDGVQIFARIRLDEYMEVGKGAGTSNQGKAAKSLDPNPNATFADQSEWRTRLPSDTDNPFQPYWTWDMAGEDNGGLTEGVVYMPTFNKNKDSVEPDVNGTFEGLDGVNNKIDAFSDYVEYTMEDTADGIKVVATKTADAIYDADDNDNDEIVLNNYTVEYAAQSGYVTLKNEDHHAKQTLGSKVITMESWLNRDAKDQTGDFWVWDEDGWAYWANPINPESATGLFLDGIGRTNKIINEDWYYGINVVAQFITADHLGRDTNEGFYREMERAPSYNALKLLNAIGVEVNTTVSDAVTLDAALALGGDITLGDTPITADKAVDVANAEANFSWTGGGTLNGGTLVADQKAYAGLFINAEKNWPVTGDGAVAATVNGTTVNAGADTKFAVYVQAVDNNVTLNNMTVTAQNGGILAEWNNDETPTTVTLNNVSVKTGSGYTATDWVNSAVAAANGAKVVINGGAYEGKHAAYVFSSGGTIIINDGTFKGALKVDAGDLIIKGGKFTSDPSAYVPEGYTVTNTDGDGEGTSFFVVSKIVF